MAEEVSIEFLLRGLEGLKEGLEKTASQFTGAQKRIQESFEKLNNIGTKLSLFVTAPLVAAGATAIHFALEAEQSEQRFDAALGKMAGAAKSFSEEAARAFGRQDDEVRSYMSTIFQLAKSLDINNAAALEMSKSISTLTYQLSAVSGFSPEDVFLKLESGLQGARRSLVQLGITMNDETVHQTLLKNGISISTTALSEQQKSLASYLTILDKTANLQTVLGDKIKSPVQQFEIMKTRVEAAFQALGNQLLPVFNLFLSAVINVAYKIESLISSFEKLNPVVQKAILLFGSLVVFSGPLAKGIATIGTALVALSSAFKLAEVAVGPWGVAMKGLARAFETLAVTLPAVNEAMDKANKTTDDGMTAWGRFEKFFNEKTNSIRTGLANFLRQNAGGVPGANALADYLESLTKVDAKTKDVGETTKGLKNPLASTFEGLKKNASDALAEVSTAINGMFDTSGVASGQMGDKLKHDIESIKKAILDAGAQSFEQQTQDVDAYNKALDAQKDKLDSYFQYATELRLVSHREYLAFLNDELSKTQEGTDKELKLRQEIAAEYSKVLDDTLEDVQRHNLLTDEEMKAFLLKQRDYYVSLGEGGAAAVKSIDDKIAALGERVNFTFSQRVSKSMKDFFNQMSDTAANFSNFLQGAFNDMSSALAQFFLTGKFSFKDFLNSIKVGLANLASREIVGALGGALFGGGGGVGTGGTSSGGGLLGGLLEGVGTGIGKKLFGGIDFSSFFDSAVSGIGSAISGAGDFIGGLLGFSEGGVVPGSGNGDTMLARLTPGEFIINKEATQQSLPLLRAINEGNVPGFAAGGLLDSALSGLGSTGLFGEIATSANIFAAGGITGALYNQAFEQFIAGNLSQEALQGAAAASSIAEAGVGFLASFAGSKLGEALFGNSEGSQIGSTIGGLIGTVAGFGPVGAFVGSFLGSAIGSLFGPGKSVGPSAGVDIGILGNGFMGVVGSGGDNHGPIGQMIQVGNQVAQLLNREIIATGLTPVGGSLNLTYFPHDGGFLSRGADGVTRAFPDINDAIKDLMTNSFATLKFRRGYPTPVDKGLRPIVSGMGNFVGDLGAAYSQLVAQGLQVSNRAMATGLATGGSRIVTGPGLLPVGEQGPEEITARPLMGAGGPSGSRGPTVVLQGVNVVDGISMARFQRNLAREVVRMQRGL